QRLVTTASAFVAWPKMCTSGASIGTTPSTTRIPPRNSLLVLRRAPERQAVAAPGATRRSSRGWPHAPQSIPRSTTATTASGSTLQPIDSQALDNSRGVVLAKDLTHGSANLAKRGVCPHRFKDRWHQVFPATAGRPQGLQRRRHLARVALATMV